MRAESATAALFKFWLLRPRTWFLPLGVAGMAALPGGFGRGPFIGAIAFAVGLVALSAALWMRSLLEVTDPPRAALTPGWHAAHTRGSALPAAAGALLLFAAAVSWRLPPTVAAMLVSVAVAAGFFVASDGPDRLTGAAAVRTRGGVAVGMVLALAALVFVVYAAAKGPPETAVFGRLAAGWAVVESVLAGQHPWFSAGVAAASAGFAWAMLRGVHARSRRLPERRPHRETPPLRRAAAGPNAAAVSPTPPAAEHAAPPPAASAFRGFSVPRSGLGRAWLFLDGLPGKGIAVVWLLLCPLCFWYSASIMPPPGTDATWEDLSRSLGMVGFLGMLASAPSAFRLVAAVGERRGLARRLLLPRSLRAAYRGRFVALLLAGAPATLCVLLYFGMGAGEMSSAGDAALRAAAWAAWFAAALLWLTLFRWVDQFAFPGLGRWLRFLLVPVFLSVAVGSCALNFGGPHDAPDLPGPAVFLTAGTLTNAAGLLITWIILRLSRGWDVVTS